MSSKEIPASHETGRAEAEVGYALGRTLNLGNFESARIDVSIKLPSKPTDRALEATFAYAKRFVERHLEAEVRSCQE